MPLTQSTLPCTRAPVPQGGQEAGAGEALSLSARFWPRLTLGSVLQQLMSL